MTKIEEEVKNLKKEYAEKFNTGQLDPFGMFFGYEGGDFQNEKKFLLKSLMQRKPLHKFEEAPQVFCEWVYYNDEDINNE